MKKNMICWIGMAFMVFCLGTASFGQDDLDALLGDLVEETAAEAEEAQPAEDAAEDAAEGAAAESAPVEPEGEEAPAPAEAAETAAEDPAAEDAETARADSSPAELLAEQIRVKKQADEEAGRMAFDRGQEAMQQKDFSAAVDAYLTAWQKIPVRPPTDEIRELTRQNLARAYMDLAELNYRRENYGEAKTAAQNVLKFMPAQRDARRLIERIERVESRVTERTAEQATVRARLEAAADEREVAVDLLIEDGRTMLDRGDYDAAEQLFEQALLRNPYHKDAMRFLKKIEERRYQLSTVNRRTTVSDMIADVREGWNPPFRAELITPEAITTGQTMDAGGGTQRLQEKMSSIVIPSIEFRQANIVDVINFLRDASEAADPEGEGVNILLNLNVGDAPAAAAPTRQTQATDPWGDLDFDEPAAASPADTGPVNIPTITLNLRRVTLFDAIKYVTEVANLKYRLEGNVVIITPANVASGRIITRLYPVQPSFLDVVIQRDDDDGGDRGGDFIEMGTGRSDIQKSDVKQFFEQAGVQFPIGSSITYNASISQLIVANTAENLEVFERILAQLNVIPNQVEIEARFVEVAQNDLQELGFEWLLTDAWEVAVKNGPAPVAGRERIVVDENASQGGMTRGLRFFNSTESGIGGVSRAFSQSAGIGGILGISSILTNPELNVVIHALSQKGGVDLLSAPRVTTRSGVNAQIEVVREIIYPSEFEADVQTIEGGEGESDTQVVVVTPGSFEQREVGVILNVTPTVGPDGYTIDLAMVPEVAELVDWIQYGSTLADGSRYNIPQPIFSSRNVSTSIVIWDGQTVVMGGLIREELANINDKVPLLGDIPILGRLFRNEGSYSQKQNLLIFVTARLVDPAGKLIHRADTGIDALPSE
jgi:general secretion pathway protein D